MSLKMTEKRWKGKAQYALCRKLLYKEQTDRQTKSRQFIEIVEFPFVWFLSLQFQQHKLCELFSSLFHG